MPLDFPNSPTTNQTWTASNGVTYTWDGSKWALASASSPLGGPYLPTAGGTVSGPLYATSWFEVTTAPFGNPTYLSNVSQSAITNASPLKQNFLSGTDTVTGTSSSGLSYNSFYVHGDNSTAPSNTLMSLSYAFGGPNFTGTPCALSVGFSMPTASPMPPSQYQMAANIFATMSASAGGTNTGAGASGNLYGLNLTPQLASGATNWMEITSAEIDSAVTSGASVSRRVNLKLCLQSNHAVQGATQDVMLEFGRIYGSSVGALKAIVLGGLEGVFPLDNTNGVFIAHEYAGNAVAGVNPQVNNYIDATHIRALSAYWASPGALLDNQGGWQIGPSRLGWGTLDVFGQTGGTPTIVAGGSGAITGQIVTTGNGDLYTVTASGGAITSLTTIVAATSRTTGSTTPQPILGDGTTGATCTIPWTNAQTFTLQPSGGTTTFGTGKVSFTGGISFGQRQTSSATDLTQHISLFDNWGGFNISGGYLNIVANSAVVLATAGSSLVVGSGIPMTVQAAFYVTGANITITGSSYPSVTLDKTAGGASILAGSVGGSTRWTVRLGDNDAEAAGNVGSSFAIYRNDNSGNLIDSPFSINRSNGAVAIPDGLGMFGHAPVTTRPTVTGAKGGNAALGSLLTALSAYGLITDSSTA